VVGFSYTFVVMDIAGAIFSILSLLFRATLDIPAIVSHARAPGRYRLILQVTFALVVVQNGLVILLAILHNPRARARRAKEAGLPASPTSTDEKPHVMSLDEEAAIEDRYRSMQTHKGSVSSANTLVGDADVGEKGKSFSRTSTLEVEDLSKNGSGRSTPAAYGRSRAQTLVDLPGLAEVDSRSEGRPSRPI
jgi:hypothetical protein